MAKEDKIQNTAELISRAQAGDRDAETQLLRSYSGTVKSIAFPFYIATSLDREDLVQEGMIGLLNAIRTFDPCGGAKFETYASRCIKNAIIDEIRHSPQPTLPIDEDIEAPSQMQLVELAEAIAAVLTPVERQVLELRLKSMSYEEISKELGIQKKKVDNLIASAKRKLKDFLNS